MSRGQRPGSDDIAFHPEIKNGSGDDSDGRVAVQAAPGCRRRRRKRAMTNLVDLNRQGCEVPAKGAELTDQNIKRVERNE